MTLVATRDAKIYRKVEPEPRPAPHQICRAQHRAQQAPLKHRSPAANTKYIVITAPEPSMSPALLVRVPQKKNGRT